MIAASRFGQPARRGERVIAFILVGLIHVGLAFVFLRGFSVRIDPRAESPLQLISVVPLSPPPPPRPPPPPPVPKKAEHDRASAPAIAPTPKGGTETPAKPRIAAPVTPAPQIVLPVATTASGGGNPGSGGASAGNGAGGGQGGNGPGDGSGGGGGSDLVQIGGAIGPGDYPRALRDSGAGGRVLMTFTVAPNGRVSRCVVTRSSGVPELDELTCRLIRERFVFRPETDRSGRPIAAEVDGEHLWTARARD